MTLDPEGNVYLAGRTAGALPGQISAGGFDAYVRKYDGEGNEVWTRQFGTTGRDRVDVAVDLEGNVYVAGQAEGALPDQVSSGDTDAFVRKYDGDGNEVWTRQFGTLGFDQGPGVAADSEGNVYLSGRGEGALPGQASSGDSDAFVRKYDRDGNTD